MSKPSYEELRQQRETYLTHSIPRAGTLEEISYCTVCGASNSTAKELTCQQYLNKKNGEDHETKY